MAKSEAELKEIVERYLNLISQEITIEKVILFGSYALGKAGEYSDIDLAVVSKDFEGKRRIDNMKFLFSKARHVDTSLEPLAFTPGELENPDKRTFPAQILKTGKVVYENKKS
jgi:predicted nucleotidyltransferase